MSFQWNSQLLAPQSGALSRDTLPIQSSPFTAFEHLSLYIQNAKGPWKHLSLYTVCDTHRATCISDAIITGKSCGEQVLEQRGDLGGIGQEPEADNKNGFRQRAEAGWAEQVIEWWLNKGFSREIATHKIFNRKLGVQEEELKRAIERAELAESKQKGIEEELQLVSHTRKSSW